MLIVLDNIIFSLQRSGGISTLWGELIGAFQERNLQTYYLEYKGKLNNIVRKTINMEGTDVIQNNSASIYRFQNPKLKNFQQKFVFCSSYYRTSSNKNALNITVVHDFTYEHYNTGFRKKIHHWQKRNAIMRSKGIICISENTKKDLLRFFPDTNHNKIKVIYNGVGAHFHPIGQKFPWSEVDTRFSTLEGKNVVIFIGQRGGYKNFDIAVKSFALLPENYHLAVVGGKFSREEEEFLNKSISQSSFTLFNNIDNVTLNKIYNKGHALLYLSSYEGFGIPVLEAMKSGLPVIANNASSIPEVAEDAGVLLNSLDPQSIKEEILKLENIDYKNELIKKGIQQASKFSWKKTMNDYYDFFNEIYKIENEK